jgi:hypothetical protein
MYEVEGIDDEQLKPHVGHRAQIDGVFEGTDRAAAHPPTANSTEDIVELKGVAIRQVAGECPARP